MRWLLLVVFAVSWLSVMHVAVGPPPRHELVSTLAARQRKLALDAGDERARLHRQNPEWDLMHRTFSVLAFTNLALAEPERRAFHLEAADALISDTLADAQRGTHFFLLPYSRGAPFHDEAQRSLFVDGEIALMLAARQTVERRAEFVRPLTEYADAIAGQLERAPRHFAESYPDEGWTFCNTIALAALRLSDRIDGRSHQVLISQWLDEAKQHLVDEKTGLLRSSFRAGGAELDGPEGSTLWLAAHMLQLVDPPFAADQYQRARAALGHVTLGFGWASEWPRVAVNVDDIDSGPTIPLLDANAGSSGLALLGAAAFRDDEFFDGLLASLELGAFPQRRDGELTYLAGNALADAVLLAALVEGPLWEAAR